MRDWAAAFSPADGFAKRVRDLQAQPAAVSLIEAGHDRSVARIARDNKTLKNLREVVCLYVKAAPDDHFFRLRI